MNPPLDSQKVMNSFTFVLVKGYDSRQSCFESVSFLSLLFLFAERISFSIFFWCLSTVPSLRRVVSLVAIWVAFLEVMRCPLLNSPLEMSSWERISPEQ